MAEIKVRVDKKGRVHAAASGYPGQQCYEATQFLRQLGQVTDDTPTSELYEAAQHEPHSETQSG